MDQQCQPDSSMAKHFMDQLKELSIDVLERLHSDKLAQSQFLQQHIDHITSEIKAL